MSRLHNTRMLPYHPSQQQSGMMNKIKLALCTGFLAEHANEAHSIYIMNRHVFPVLIELHDNLSDGLLASMWYFHFPGCEFSSKKKSGFQIRMNIQSASMKREGSTHIYSKGSSKTRVKVVNAQLKSDTKSILQPKPGAVKPPSTATVDNLRASYDVEVNAYGKPYFADLANLLFLLVDISQENVPYTSEPSPTLKSLRIAMDSTNFNLSLTMEFDMDATTLVDGPQSLYPASLTARQRYTGAYGVETVLFSPLSETQSAESSSHDDCDLPSIDRDVALDAFFDSLGLESEPPLQQAPSQSVLSDYFNLSSYWLSDLGTFGVSTLNFGVAFELVTVQNCTINVISDGSLTAQF
ncbi:hypothetical protein EV421DRAFT_1932431 [Armillaria borealis]|uniref:Uncharacterized protein n=1 Tax=Armillaria borealis TaxID=47425 RepID=A0AA39ME97_9AGAR|nr:hypothetical protein EV421DRAFT_1932431 [Armillaria borealis]